VSLAVALVTTLCCASCSSGAETVATGPSYSPPSTINDATYDASAAYTSNGASIDTSHAAKGYVGISATSASRLKATVATGSSTQQVYDLPSDGTPIIVPLSMGDGTYEIRVMQNTSGDRYVELCSTSASVTLETEFAPFLRPNIYCDYTDSSNCVARARELAEGCENQAEILNAVFDYITQNVSYDTDKASVLADQSGYLPDPDDTLSSGTGICLDYASLGAAMLRSQGIPAQIVTGTVSPDDIYHAWIMVYISGTWQTAQISVEDSTWSRVDLTFAAGSGPTDRVGDGKTYTDRYVY